MAFSSSCINSASTSLYSFVAAPPSLACSLREGPASCQDDDGDAAAQPSGPCQPCPCHHGPPCLYTSHVQGFLMASSCPRAFQQYAASFLHVPSLLLQVLPTSLAGGCSASWAAVMMTTTMLLLPNSLHGPCGSAWPQGPCSASTASCRLHHSPADFSSGMPTPPLSQCTCQHAPICVSCGHQTSTEQCHGTIPSAPQACPKCAKSYTDSAPGTGKQLFVLGPSNVPVPACLRLAEGLTPEFADGRCLQKITLGQGTNEATCRWS